MAIRKVCTASNSAWVFISCVAITGSLFRGSEDVLFLARYCIALVSSTLSLVAIKVYPRRILGLASIFIFFPFILLEILEICIVYKCGNGWDSFWGVDCSSLIMYRDESRLLELITDQLAVLLLSITNIWILWKCHVQQGHFIYGMRKLRKSVSAEPFLSAVSSVGNGLNEFISADEDGEYAPSPKKVLIFSFRLYLF